MLALCLGGFVGNPSNDHAPCNHAQGTTVVRLTTQLPPGLLRYTSARVRGAGLG